MKTICITFLALFITLSCFGQEIEFCNSLNTSSEQRFQNAWGLGFQYQHPISAKFKLGFGNHYHVKKSEFDYIPYIDADPNLVINDKISSNSQRFSFRFNIQGLILNNEYASISLGPEISYNYLWGNDQIKRRVGQNSSGIANLSDYSQNIDLTKSVGLGLISKIEIKNFLTPKLSLCFTIRPEIITSGIFAKGMEQVFSGVLGFTEFQLGLKYSFKSN